VISSAAGRNQVTLLCVNTGNRQKYVRCVSKMGQVGCNRRNTRSCHLCFFFIPPSGSFFSSLPLLFRYSYSLTFMLIFSSGLWLLVLVPFLSCCHFLIYGRPFFSPCPFLITHDKLLLSTPKFSLFHLGIWVALFLLFSLPFFPSRLAWLIRTGIGGGG